MPTTETTHDAKAPPDLARDLSARCFRRLALALLCAHAVSVTLLAGLVPWTPDEPTYLHAGRLLRDELSFEPFVTYLHGPLPFYANQLTTLLGVPVELPPGDPFAGRLGMLPFTLLAAAALTLLARRAFGETAALLALALYCVNPLVLGHAPLMTTDMSLVGLYLLCLYGTWRYLERPSLLVLLGIGTALGAALATKYLGLFLVPVLGLTLLVAVVRGFRPGLFVSREGNPHGGRLPARLADALLVGLACAAVAWVVLWACYLFACGGYDTTGREPMSRFLARLVELPGVPALLALLPDPWVRGVDYMKSFAETGGTSYLCGHIGQGHWDYYLVALLVKMPLALLCLLPFGAFGRRPPWPRGLPVPFWLGLSVPLVYLSLFQVLQLGLRHMLQVVPLLCLLAARPLATWWRHGLAGHKHLGRLLVGAAFVWLLACHAITWPRYVGAFNSLVGDRPYLWFRDSNLCWTSFQVPDQDELELRRRHPDAQRVYLRSGPRLGTVLAYAPDLCEVADPDGNAHHWLRRFCPIDHLGAWFVFGIDEPTFRRALADDRPAAAARGQVELASALATSGHGDTALEVLAGLDGLDAEGAAQGTGADPAVVAAVRTLVELQRQGATDAAGYAQALFMLARLDLLAAHEHAPLLLRATALFLTAQLEPARAVLLAEAARRPLAPEETMYLAFLHMHLGQHRIALDVLDALELDPSDPRRAQLDALHQRIQHDFDYLKPMQQRLGR